MLSLKNIVKDYGEGENKVAALKGVSVDFRRNEFVSVLGPSGCGKTTLLNIIGGLDRYTSGDLVIEGKSTKNYTDKDWDAYRNNSIGFVFQSYNLIPHQTILANVELALTISGVGKAERRERALAVLEKVGLKNQVHKKPNQLSGGQMQRVAIARALINNPEVILADEPTGALDTETSIQVMELLKEVAKDRLVIMVTHNPELAKKYSTRIIRFLDGEKVDDTDPYTEDEDFVQKRAKKPRMGYKTAFSLSLRNLFSKKARTALTSIAGSIGIIGVALVLALSNGFNIYMSRMQTDTLSAYPLTISESSVDLSSFQDIYENETVEEFPELDNVFVQEAFEKLTGMLKANDLLGENDDGVSFLDYLKQLDPELYYSIQYDYGFDMNKYVFSDITINESENFSAIDTVVQMLEASFEGMLTSSEIGSMISVETIRSYIPTITEMPDSEDLIKEQYDLIYGDWPTFRDEDYNQVVHVVDQYNRISDITLLLLGYVGGTVNEKGDFSFDGTTEIDFSEIVGKDKLYLADNSLAYVEAPDGYHTKVQPSDTADREGFEKLDIVGVVRVKENVDSGVLDTGIAYTTALTEHVLEINKDSELVQKVQNGERVEIINDMLASNPDSDYYKTPYSLRMLAGNSVPATVSVYARDFDSKKVIKQHIDNWNAQFEEGDERIIAYSDMMDMMFGMLNTMVNAVSYVLIAFTSISLVVSSVMIGIITYISVVERTKEIGVLRSLGASKFDIANVFNAETFLIGLFAGLIGIGVTYLLSIPLNLILGSLIADVGSLVILKPLHALLLVVISFVLTLIAGLIPARIASKKDPVVALRTE